MKILKYVSLFLLCGASVLLAGCIKTSEEPDFDTTGDIFVPKKDTLEESGIILAEETILYRNETLWFQLLLPAARTGWRVGEDYSFTTFSLPDKDEPEAYNREIIRIETLTKEKYDSLLQKPQWWIDLSVYSLLWNNEKYYFVSNLANMDIDLESQLTISRKRRNQKVSMDKGSELFATFGISGVAFKDHLLNWGFSTFPPNPPHIPLQVLEKIDEEKFLYKNDEFWFQFTLPKTFETAKIYTKHKYNDIFHDARYDHDSVMFTLYIPIFEGSFYDPYLPESISAGDVVVMYISIISTNIYDILPTKWMMGWREYLEQTTLWHNNKYYFTIGLGNMSEEEWYIFTSPEFKGEIEKRVKESFSAFNIV